MSILRLIGIRLIIVGITPSKRIQRKSFKDLDDTDGDSLPHVPDGKPSQGRELGKGLNAHGLARDQLHDGSVARLDELWSVLSGLAGTSVNLLQDLCKLASDVRCVAV